MAVLTRRVVDLAKRCARADGSASLKTAHVLAGVADDEARALLRDLCMDGKEVVVPPLLGPIVERARSGPEVGEKLPLDGTFKVVFQAASEETAVRDDPAQARQARGRHSTAAARRMANLPGCSSHEAKVNALTILEP